MRTKEDRFHFTEHSLQRGLERMLDKHKPYTQKDYNNIKILVTKSMVWNGFDCKWTLPDYDLELVIEGSNVVTISPSIDAICETYYGSKPLTEYQKVYTKKCFRLGRMRNAKNRDKKG